MPAQSDLGVAGVTKEDAVMHHKEQAIASGGLSQDDLDFISSFPEEKRKKVLRKVDLRVVPLLLFLYLLAYLDKTNIGNAQIEGLSKDLGLNGIQYNVALSIFFIPYVLAEVPSNMVLDKIARPSWYLGTLVVLWGVIMLCTGFVHNYAGLVAIRFLLGLFEAGFFPGAILLISKWYLPDETQQRIALLYTSAATGGAFSGLLAFAIVKMDGSGGLAGWRWIFIIEGIFTVVVGLGAALLLPDSPSLTSGWLTPEEIRYLELRQVSRRLSRPGDYREKHFSLKSLAAVLTDWKLFPLVVANWSNAVPNYALKFTLPSIVKSMGFRAANAQLLTIPPYACGAISSYVLSVLADKYTWRMPFIVGPQTCVIAAFAILFAKADQIRSNIGLCYFGVCLACFGMYPIFPGVNAWNVANQAGAGKRAASIGFLVAMGNAGGVVGSYIYKADEAPRYPTGYGTSFAFAAAGIVAAVGLEFCLWRSNRRNEGREDEIRAKYTDEELDAMGDRSPLYRYAL